MSDAVIETNTDLTGKTALVTGASSGLGVRFAKVLAAAGARVVIAARRIERLTQLAEVISDNGGTAHPVALDVADLPSIKGFFDGLNSDGLLPDILINNAGINTNKLAVDIDIDEYQRVMDTNLAGPFFIASEMAKYHLKAGTAARIVNIASVAGYKALPGLAPYSMSKSAVIMMTRALASEWARHDINVNSICPGYIETEINDFWWKTEGGQKQITEWPRRRLAGQDDLDGVILLLSGPLGKGITGTSITVDDGQYI